MLTNYNKLAVRLTGWVPDKYPELLNPVSPTLPKSGITISPKNYVSIICFTSFIGYVIALVTFFPLNMIFLKLNTLVTTLCAVFFPFLIGVAVFLTGVFYPYQRVLSRRKSIETNLPFAIAHMGAIASSGVPPSAIFKLLSEFREYDVLADDTQKIVRNVEVFGLDPISAMREVARRTASEKFRQLLMGLATTIEGGGDLKTYLKNAGEQSLFTWRMKRQKYLQQLSTYAEFYTGLLIASPLFLISLFSVMHMIQPQLGGMDILQLMKLSIYLIIPTLNIGFLLFLKTTQVEM